MPTNRRKIKRPKRGDELPRHVQWFMEHQRLIKKEEAAELGFDEGEQLSILLMCDGGFEMEMRCLGLEIPSGWKPRRREVRLVVDGVYEIFEVDD